MTSSENIYDDLMGTDLGENIQKLERTNQALQRHIEKLEGDIRKLCTELTEMKRIQQNLKRNISELFKTAKAEIARKDRMIADLRTELDRLIFRRQTPSEPLKRPTRESLSDPEPKRHKSEDTPRVIFRRQTPSEPLKRPTRESLSDPEPKRHKSEDTPRVYSKLEGDDRRRKSEPRKHEDLKTICDRSRRKPAEDDRRRKFAPRSTHRDFRAASRRPRGRDTRSHSSRRRSRDRRRRRSESGSKTKPGKADTTKSIETKTVTNGVSSSVNELPELRDERRPLVIAQEHVIDSTVPCSSRTAMESGTSELEPGELVELTREPRDVAVVAVLVEEPTVLKRSDVAVLVKEPAVLKRNDAAVLVKEAAVLNGSDAVVLVKEPSVLNGSDAAVLVKEPAVLNRSDAIALVKEDVVLNESDAAVLVEEPAVLNGSDAAVLVKESAMLNESDTAAALPANNSVVGRRPTRRRRCVVQIMD